MSVPAVAFDPPGTAYALMSFHYFGGLDFDAWRASHGFAPNQPRIFADSGAYSAMNLGVPIALGDYAAWCNRWAHAFDCYANLDVIGDWRATLVNQKRMEDAGLTPVPVFHSNTPVHVLEREYRDYKYIALGALTERDAGAIKRFAVMAMRARPDAVFHGFGVTTAGIIVDLPFYSVDSSSVTAAVRFKTLTLWNPVRCRIEHVHLNFAKDVWRHRKLIEAHGGDLTRLTRTGATYWEWLPVATVGMYRLMHYCRARHGVIALPDGRGAGLRLYHANTNERQTGAMVRWAQERGL